MDAHDSTEATVVICFHFTIFVVLETTHGRERETKNQL